MPQKFINLTAPIPLFSMVAIVLTGVVMVSTQQQFYAPWLIAYILSINSVTFLLYGYDKAVAQYALPVWRVPENVLHGVTLAGGTPAAVLAQKVLRHKTIKASFRSRFWLIVAIQVGIVVAWLGYRIF